MEGWNWGGKSTQGESERHGAWLLGFAFPAGSTGKKPAEPEGVWESFLGHAPGKLGGYWLILIYRLRMLALEDLTQRDILCFPKA
jgi:hypothetical protein